MSWIPIGRRISRVIRTSEHMGKNLFNMWKTIYSCVTRREHVGFCAWRALFERLQTTPGNLSSIEADDRESLSGIIFCTDKLRCTGYLLVSLGDQVNAPDFICSDEATNFRSLRGNHSPSSDALPGEILWRRDRTAASGGSTGSSCCRSARGTNSARLAALWTRPFRSAG